MQSYSVSLAAISIALILRLPEGPKFLLSKGKADEARSVLQRMGVTNKVKYDFTKVNLTTEDSIKPVSDSE